MLQFEWTASDRVAVTDRPPFYLIGSTSRVVALTQHILTPRLYTYCTQQYSECIVDICIDKDLILLIRVYAYIGGVSGDTWASVDPFVNNFIRLIPDSTTRPKAFLPPGLIQNFWWISYPYRCHVAVGPHHANETTLEFRSTHLPTDLFFTPTSMLLNAPLPDLQQLKNNLKLSKPSAKWRVICLPPAVLLGRGRPLKRKMLLTTISIG